MKVALFMAMSVNGYIARENGDEDFLSHQNWLSFCDVAKEFGCFIIGRKTYETVQKWDEEYNFDTIVGVKKVIVSKNIDFLAKEEYIVADSPVNAINKLQDIGLEKVLVVGGATINSAFMKEGLVDELLLNVEPCIVGDGIPIFSKDKFDCRLELLDSKDIGDGIIQYHYRVLK